MAYKTIPVLCLALLSGCALQKPVDQQYHAFKEKDAPLKELTRNSREIETQMRSLNKISATINQSKIGHNKHKQDAFNLKAVPANFEKRVTFDFTGRADKAIQAIGTMADYETQVIGKRPAHDLVVNLHAHNKRLIDIIWDLDAQVGNAATLNIYGNSKVVQFIFNKEV